MIKSLVENQFNDDLIMRNYMALLACILNPKLSSSASLRYFNISDNNEIKINSKNTICVKNKLSKNYRKIKVIDTFTNEHLIFESVYEAEKYTGVKKENIYVYIKRDILGKRRFKFKY